MDRYWFKVERNICDNSRKKKCCSVADLLELTPVRQKPKFSHYFEKDSMKNSLGFSSWYLSKYAELTEILMENWAFDFDLRKKKKKSFGQGQIYTFHIYDIFVI